MIEFISGGIAKDHRGQIRYVNDFDMSLVKRFYIIKNSDINLVRGWRAHRIEQRWFYVLSGSFLINIVEIDNWDMPSKKLNIKSIVLNSEEERMFHVSKGYGTAIQACAPDSEILVFSDYGIENAVKDDYTYSLDYFENYKK